ncbi:MAG: sigma 54-interacting transcriptional regulator [Deltaproteobacteria bacterium]|nr:sigma 54-interacting transcriptional regulator [Deltaproteobacteria bacterium]
MDGHVKYRDLDIRELLELAPQHGTIRFAGARALLVDTAAVGVLRAHLVDTLGERAARGIFTRFGYALGWRTGEALKHAVPWDDERELRRAGGHIHTHLGYVRVEPIIHDDSDPDAPFAEAIWHDSFEADEHLLHHGLSTEPVCWMLTGFASGFASFVNGHELDVVFVEDRCRGRGDPSCHIVARRREQWGHAVDDVLPFYRDQCLEGALDEVTRALKRTESRLRKRRAEIREAAGSDEVSGIVVKSEPMKRVVELARRIAKVDATVLVAGESGAGKERIARLIHDESTRAGKPFVAINCGALSETLLESELFGHARGAFTGAVNDRPGLFEAAHGGTLFLDEVGEVTASMQVKLLRVLQEREIMRVGETRTRKVDVRVVAATNRDLSAEVEAGRFRKDLFYRLRVVELRVPPLRERRDDVLPLARVLLAQSTLRMGRKVAGLTPAVADQLLRYEWPGNVRELENALERAVALAEGPRIDVHDLPEEVRAALPSLTPVGKARTLDAMEREYIMAVLAANDGNQTRTAKQLGIGESTLYRKLKSYGGKRR